MRRVLLNLGDQSANLWSKRMLRRFVKKGIQSVKAFLIMAQVDERLSEDELGRGGAAFALVDRDLCLVASPAVVLLMQVGVSEQVMRKPVFVIGKDRLFEGGSS